MGSQMFATLFGVFVGGLIAFISGLSHLKIQERRSKQQMINGFAFWMQN